MIRLKSLLETYNLNLEYLPKFNGIRLKSLISEQLETDPPEETSSDAEQAETSIPVPLLTLGVNKLVTGDAKLQWDTAEGFWNINISKGITDVVRNRKSTGRVSTKIDATLPKVVDENKSDQISFIVRKYVAADGNITGVELIRESDTKYKLKIKYNLGNSNKPGRSDWLVTISGFTYGHTYTIEDDQDSVNFIKVSIPAPYKPNRDVLGRKDTEGAPNSKKYLIPYITADVPSPTVATTKDKFICLVWKKETNNFTKQSDVDTAETNLETQLYGELDNFFYKSLKEKQFGSGSPEVADKTIKYIRDQGYFDGGDNTTTNYQTKTYFNPSKDKDGSTKEYVTISCGIRSTKKNPTTGNLIDWETYKENIQTFITTVQNKIQRSKYEDNEEE